MKRPHTVGEFRKEFDELSLVYSGYPASLKERGLLAGMLNKALGGKTQRKELTLALCNYTSVKEGSMPGCQVKALLEMFNIQEDFDGMFLPDYVVQELKELHHWALIELGQKELGL